MKATPERKGCRMTRTQLRTMTLALLAGLAAGCASAPEEQPPLLQPQAQGRQTAPRTGVRAVSEMIGSAKGPAAPGAKLLTTQRMTAPSRGPVGSAPGAVDSAPGELRSVRYAVKDAAAQDVLRVLVGELLGRPYIVGVGVNGSVTFDLDEDMTTADLERFVGALATAFGWTVQDRDGVLVFSGADTVATAPDAPVLQDDAAFPSDRPAVRVFRFDHIAPSDAKSVIADLSNKATAKSIVVGRHLVVAERTEQLARFASLFASLDVPAFEGVELWTYQLAHLKPRDMVETLRTIGTSAGLASDRVAFIPLGDSPRLMVVSKDPSLQPLVRRWINQLDLDATDQPVQRYVYRIQHYEPAELQTVLQQLLIGKAIIGGATSDAGQMRLVFAPAAKQVIIDATPTQYADLVSVLSVIDRPPQQVQLQAVIAEVTLNDALEYGVEYFLSVETGSGPLELAGDALNLPAKTGSAFFVGGDGFALVEALDRESDVTVLSTPTITVRDGIEATFQVGGETPVVQSVIDSGGQTSGSSDLRNEIIYRDTGITLTVQPDINESGFVTLKIQQEVNDAVTNTTSGIDSPEFTTRMIDTEVVAPHGATLLLGGIVLGRDTTRVDRVPLLGELPLIGPLFSMNRTSTDRTELIITITPTIIDDPTAAGVLVTDFMNSAQSLDRSLSNWAPSLPDDLLNATEPDGAPAADEPADAPPAGDTLEAEPVADGSYSALGILGLLYDAARASG